ncbi:MULTISPECIES: hypothetical protein [unclassified Nonomuraea]
MSGRVLDGLDLVVALEGMRWSMLLVTAGLVLTAARTPTLARGGRRATEA